MHSYRTAVLVFAIGASAANFFAFKAKVDAWYAAPKPKPTVAARPSPMFSDGFVDPFALPSTTGTVDDSEAVAAYNTYRGRKAAAFDAAMARELAIVTVAGVAWFLIRSENTVK